jgi:hypothetical protein
MTSNTLDLVLNWPRAPIPLAVDMLKAIYERAREPQAQAAQGVGGPGELGERLASTEAPDLSHILTAVSLLQSAAKGVVPPPSSYDEVRRYFLDFQTQLRRQKLAIEGLVGRTFDASAPNAVPVFQQSLHLRCPRGGRTAGRFRCVNRTARRTTVTVTSERLLGDVTGRLDGATIAATPSTCALDPHESQTFVVDVDFSTCSLGSDREAGASLEIAMDGEIAMKVWIAVELDDRV